MQKPVLVIKLGTAVLTDVRGDLVQATIRKVAAEVAAQLAAYRVVLVSSGAVALVVLGGLFFFNRMETAVADRV